MNLTNPNIDELFEKIKRRPTLYDEELHCPMILYAMLNQGRVSAFCVKATISEQTFYTWVKNHTLFHQCYMVGEVYARENWELEGYNLRNVERPIGVVDNAYDHWKMIGWSRFGVSKNGRIKLRLNPEDSPDKHYAQLLKQASEGAFTASEIKQLMEAINVGLNTHQVFELQKQIDELKSNLDIMSTNSNGNNSVSAKGIAQKD